MSGKYQWTWRHGKLHNEKVEHPSRVLESDATEEDCVASQWIKTSVQTNNGTAFKITQALKGPQYAGLAPYMSVCACMGRGELGGKVWQVWSRPAEALCWQVKRSP